MREDIKDWSKGREKGSKKIGLVGREMRSKHVLLCIFNKLENVFYIYYYGKIDGK